MSDPTKIVRRPDTMDLDPETMMDEPRSGHELAIMVFRLMAWARYIESRLAKYETHHPDPKPGEASIVKHTAYDPDAKPGIMIDLNQFAEFEVLEYSLEEAMKHMESLHNWARHLEYVREGLQSQINHWERMYQKDHDPTRRDPKSAN